MPKAHKEYRTFIRGLITENSPLSFPEDASIDEDYMILNLDGTRQVRQGMDYETGYVLSAAISNTIMEDKAIVTIPWIHADNSELNNFVVVQIGSTLYIHDMSNATIGGYVATIDIAGYKTVYASNFGVSSLEGVAYNGKLLLVSKDTDPLVISYDSTTGIFSIDTISLKIRDFREIDDGVDLDSQDTVVNKISVRVYLPGGSTTLANIATLNANIAVGRTITEATTGATAVITHIIDLGMDGDYRRYSYLVSDVQGTFVVGNTIDPFTTTNLSITFVGANTSGTATDEYKYNLYNAGWTASAVASYVATTGEYPSKTKVWWRGKDPSGDFDPVVLDKQYFGTSKAPLGHYILDAFDRDRTGVSGLAVEEGISHKERNRPSTVAYWAGRAWYSGIQSSPVDLRSKENYNGIVFFSQIIKNDRDLGKCYQEADPTSEFVPDIVDTDGGYINIMDAGAILKVINRHRELVIIATNGIWVIAGGDEGFTPTNFFISKISNVGAVNKFTIVEVEGTIFYWANEGIYAITVDPNSGELTSINITQSTIQTHYDTITNVAKTSAKGVYDPVGKKIRWLYNNSSAYNGVAYKYEYNKELIFDVTLKAFYPNTIKELTSNSPKVAGVFVTPRVYTATQESTVVVEGDVVQSSGIDVHVEVEEPSNAVTALKYLVVVPQVDGVNRKYTFGRYKNSNFNDWEEADGTGASYVGFLVTGHEMLEDTTRGKQPIYISTHYTRTESEFVDDGSGNAVFDNPSSAKLQARWDWSNSSDSGRWSNPIQTYRYNRPAFPGGSLPSTINYGQDVIATKNKLRGGGKALSLKFSAEANNDMRLLGWGIDYEIKGAI